MKKNSLFEKIMNIVGGILFLLFLATLTLCGAALDSNASIQECVPYIVVMLVCAIMFTAYSFIAKEN